MELPVEEQQKSARRSIKLLPGTELIISTKADIHETQPLNWQEVKDAEKNISMAARRLSRIFLY